MIAVTRAVSPKLAEGERTHRNREPIDAALADQEHAQYEDALRSLGVKVVRARDEAALPDGVFVEDTAVVLDEVAILTNPGAESRRKEVASVGDVLVKHRPLAKIQAPGTLDGGDVLQIGRTLYVGMSTRSNPEGVAQLQGLVQRYRYKVVPVPLVHALHLKSAVTSVGNNMLLINPSFVPVQCFGATVMIAVAQSEPDAANALRVGDAVLYPAQFPETKRRLERAGLRVVSVPVSQITKAEGGVTCCSIVFEDKPAS